MMRRILVSVWLAVGVLAWSAPPKLMLWQWEWPEQEPLKLPSGAGVAYLIAEVTLKGSEPIGVQPRRQEFRVPAGTFEMPVIRIDAEQKPAYTARQRQEIIQLAGEVLEYTGARALQVDFDAPVSGRRFYREVLAGLRRKIGPGVFLSMTALVSWCQERPSWLEGLAVDEMVPMVFRTGNARELAVAPGQSGFGGCRQSVGVSLDDEILPKQKPGRLYLFRGYGPKGRSLEDLPKELR
jgi:hypothetical protein